MAQQRSLSRRMLFTIIGTLFLLFIILIIGEVGFRVFYAVKDISIEKPEPAPPYNTAQKEDKIGWRPKANYLFDGTMKDKDDVKYPVHLTTNENGFRQFGNPKSEKTKVFFLGDSYTQSVEVSDDKTFYKIIGDSLPIEVFAYGMAGYGQLQQYMILDEYYDLIQPDVLVLQVCSNDFIDNHHKVEIESGYKVGLRRPYLTLNDEIEYHHPVARWKKVEKYSRFLGFIFKRWDNAQQNMGKKDSAEKKIAEQKRDYKAYNHSVKLTEQAIQRIIKKAGNKTKIIVFNAGLYEPQTSEFGTICKNNQITYTTSPADSIKIQEHNSITVRAKDGYHWNERGHEVVANALIKELQGILEE